MPFARSPRDYFYDPAWAADLLSEYVHGDANGEYSGRFFDLLMPNEP